MLPFLRPPMTPSGQRVGSEPRPHMPGDKAGEDVTSVQLGCQERFMFTTEVDEEDQWFCKLCDKCKCLIKDAVESSFSCGDTRTAVMPNKWWHKVIDLEKQHEKCDLCTFALAELVANLDTSGMAQLRDWDATLSANCIIAQRNYSIHLRLERPLTDLRPELPFKAPVGHSFAVIRIQECSEHIMIHNTSLDSSSTKSQATIEKIASWLQNCNDHDACRQWREYIGAPRRMPSRLLEIDYKSSCRNVRLVSMDEDQQAARQYPYATLSHCWGGQVPTRLLSHNLEQLMTQITLDDLPATFKDAIFVARRLGFRYLWIDSLCIIQDSREDWQAQSRQMAGIYANCSLNISASASRHSREGLFRDRTARQISAFTACVSKINVICYPDAWSDEVVDAPLTSRAWVMQERILAPRVVHFGERQVHWDCVQSSCSECLPIGVNVDFSIGPGGRKRVSKDTLDKFAKQGTHHRDLYFIWDQLVLEYSQCKLTFPSDRPVAAIGLSQAFVTLLGLKQDDFILGMWSTRLTYELMWCGNSHDRKRYTGAGGARLPSWSWYSMTGAVVNHSVVDIYRGIFDAPMNINPRLMTVLQTHQVSRDTLTSDSEYSTVKLSGPICEIKTSATNFGHYSNEYTISLNGTSTLGATPHAIYWDDSRESEVRENTTSRLYLLLGALDEAMQIDRTSLRYKQIPAFARAAKAGSELCDEAKANDYSKAVVRAVGKYTCLVLKPTGVAAHFERVGYMTFGRYNSQQSYISWEDSIAQWVKRRDALDKAFQSGDLPAHLHEGMDEYGRYKINLV